MWSCWRLNVSVHQAEHLSLESIRSFLLASDEIRFESQSRAQRYAWVEQLLVQQQYAMLGKTARGLVRRYIEKMTGISRAQLTRLIGRYLASGQLKPTVYRRHSFPRRYTRADIELLAAADEVHECLSGPATRRILEREHSVYGKAEFARLASISVAHLYNLRRHPRYRQRLLPTTKTRPTQASIGERRKPMPQGQPGYLRLDTVHQGDPQGHQRGVYHINAVDEVTQWEAAAAVPRISEIYLQPVLKQMLSQFPSKFAASTPTTARSSSTAPWPNCWKSVSIRARPYFRGRMQGDELEAWRTPKSRRSAVAAARQRLQQLWRHLSRAD